MAERYKNEIIQEIDKVLQQVPTNEIKCFMNQYVSDYIYKSSVLKRNLECGVCDNCRKNNMSDCEHCELYLKKEALFKSLKFSKILFKRNQRKSNLKRIFSFFGKTFVKVTIILVALFGITFDSTVKKIFYDYIPVSSIYLREQELKCLRINFSREYIENQLGKPKSISEIKLFKKSYFKTFYVDKYYTLLCYYTDTGSLLGYMIISNSNDFRYQCYRSDVKLLEHSVSETRNILEEEGITSQPIISDNYDGERLDNSKYYYECKMQHSYGALEICYVGFGFTEVGYPTAKIEPGMDPENIKINFLTVFGEYYFNEQEGGKGYFMTDFINDYVIDAGSAGISKGNLVNLSEDIDFNDTIEKYLNENKR